MFGGLSALSCMFYSVKYTLFTFSRSTARWTKDVSFMWIGILIYNTMLHCCQLLFEVLKNGNLKFELNRLINSFFYRYLYSALPIGTRYFLSLNQTVNTCFFWDISRTAPLIEKSCDFELNRLATFWVYRPQTFAENGFIFIYKIKVEYTVIIKKLLTLTYDNFPCLSIINSIFSS